MDISLGFVVSIILILFPGLIFRRLFFYGEFSKQFNSGHNLIVLIALCTIPGLIILTSTYWLYDTFFTNIELGNIIDEFKNINSSDFRFKEKNISNLEFLLRKKATPFLGFLYLISIILGLLSGRFIRFSNLDTRFKLLRYKNYWFYLFNGQLTNFKKLKHLKKKNKQHLFTKADVLIDSNDKTLLYSGFVVDYELDSNDSTKLSKIILENAERYSLRDGKKVPVEIPGQILIIDCLNLININLTYIYTESKNILDSKIPENTNIIFSVFILLILPLFFFKIDFIEWEYYKYYFTLPWYSKIVLYVLTTQCLTLFNPYIKENDSYKKVNVYVVIFKITLIAVLSFVSWFLIK